MLVGLTIPTRPPRHQGRESNSRSTVEHELWPVKELMSFKHIVPSRGANNEPMSQWANVANSSHYPVTNHPMGKDTVSSMWASSKQQPEQIPFDVRVATLMPIYRDYEQAKKREYGDHVWEVEQASCTPLPLGAWVIFFQWLADMLSYKNNLTYDKTLAWLRCTPASISYSVVHPW